MYQGSASLSCKQTEVGSIPTVSTERKVAGYGWPGHGANVVSPRGNAGSTPSPSAGCPGGETDIMPRFERGVPGSTPGRGTDSPVVEWPRRLPDTEEIGGSIPPGTTDGRATRLVTGLAWNASEPEGLVGSTPTPSAVSVV